MNTNKNLKKNKSENSNQSDSKTNEDFNKQKPLAKDFNHNRYNPNTEVPLLGGDDKEINEDITMNRTKDKDHKAKKKLANEKRIKERDSETITENSHP